ncbi:MAG: ribonuclease Z, partial [Deltaproteobacteria bacterium]
MAPSLTLLGTGTALPHPQRGPTAGLLQTPDARVLLDCGSGTLQKAAAAGADLFSLDALLLTHVHLDHLADLLPLAFALSIPRIERSAPLQVILSHEALRTWNRLQDALDPWLTPPATNLTLRPLHPGEDLHTLG